LFHRGPIATPGQRIGLLGGSFDPPHPGHVHITRWALRTLGLDRVWWLVSPGNPLKPRGPAAIERRVAACRTLIDHPRVTVTDIERHLATRYTADTLARLSLHYPGVRFVWGPAGRTGKGGAVAHCTPVRQPAFAAGRRAAAWPGCSATLGTADRANVARQLDRHPRPGRLAIGVGRHHGREQDCGRGPYLRFYRQR
jgi:hypothetical protein